MANIKRCSIESNAFSKSAENKIPLYLPSAVILIILVKIFCSPIASVLRSTFISEIGLQFFANLLSLSFFSMTVIIACR